MGFLQIKKEQEAIKSVVKSVKLKYHDIGFVRHLEEDLAFDLNVNNVKKVKVVISMVKMNLVVPSVSEIAVLDSKQLAFQDHLKKQNCSLVHQENNLGTWFMSS